LILSETVEKGQANHSIKRPISIPKIYWHNVPLC